MLLERSLIEVEGKPDNWEFSPVIIWKDYETKIRKFKTISAWTISLYDGNVNKMYLLGNLPIIWAFMQSVKQFVIDVFTNYKLSSFINVIELLDYISGQWPFCLDDIGDWLMEIIDKILTEEKDLELVSKSVASIVRVLSRALIYKRHDFFTSAIVERLVK